MEIAIKSETDSRVFVYPLIKALYNYGTIAIYTSNRNMMRLIENDLEGGFKNVRIVVSPESDLNGTKEADGYYAGKYDFTIFDNIGAIDYDMLITLVTNRLSESFMQDLLYVIADPKTHVIKYGSPAPMSKSDKPSKAKPNSKDESDDDRDFNKWKIEKTDEDILRETLQDRQTRWCKFPTWEAVENMESRHIMMTPDDTVIKEIYRLFGDKLSIDERQFTKGARLKDESSSNISGTDVR